MSSKQSEIPTEPTMAEDAAPTMEAGAANGEQANSASKHSTTHDDERKQDDEKRQEKASAETTSDESVNPSSQSQVPQDTGQFQRPRPVEDYLKEDDSLPGWLWTAGGVALIAGLDAADDSWSDDDDRTPTNRAPTFDETGPITLSTDEDNAVTFSVEASDREGDELLFSTSGLENGSIEQGENENEFIYTPNENFSGEETFSLGVRDASNPSSTESIEVTITVNSVNDAPVVEAERTVETNENTAITFEVEATDADDDTLQYTVAEGDNAPQFGTVNAGNDEGEFIYTPNDDFTGFDSFDIIVSDSEQDTVQTVLVTVGEPPTYQLSVNDVEQLEGDDDNGQLVFTLTLDKPVENQDLIIAVTPSGDNASDDDINVPETVTIPVGAITAELAVQILGDNTNEPDQQVDFSFGNAQLQETATATATILNDDPDVTVGLSEASDTGKQNDDGITQSTEVTFTITTASDASVQLYDGDELLGNAGASESEPGQYTLATELSEGEHAITAVVTPEGGTPVVSQALDIIVDNTGPALDSISASQADNSATLTFSEEIGELNADDITFTLNDQAIEAVLDSLSSTTAVFTFDSAINGGDSLDLAVAANAVFDIAGNALPEIILADDPGGVTV